MFWLLIAILVISLIYWFIIRPLQHWRRLGIPQDSTGNLLIEAITGFLGQKSVSTLFEELHNKFHGKRYAGLYQLFTPYNILLRDPELIKQITIKDFDFFTDRTNFLPPTGDEVWHKNLFSLKGNTWRDMRATLSPAFTSKKLKTMYPLMIECAQKFVKYFELQKDNVITINIKEVFEKFTNDVIATSAFGITVNSLENPTNEFYLMGKDIFDFSGISKICKMMVIFFFPRIATLLGFTFFTPKTVDFFRKVIKENIKSRENDGIIRSDMIQLLLQAKHNRADNEEDEAGNNDFSAINDQSKQGKINKAKLTDEDIVAHAFLFFFGGFEPVSSAMTFMAYELAVNPEIQQRLYQEIQGNLEKHGTPPTYESLLTLEYLDMVISETLRKYPTGSSVLERKCVRPYTIQPTTEDETPVQIKDGQSVCFAIIGLHRDSKLFPNPERFDPERFNAENKCNIISGSYLPFGLGPRHCIASRFALVEIKVLFYYLITEFEFVVVDKTPIPLRYSKSQMFLGIEPGSCLGLKKRS